ncbi:MAG: aminodeoxychorismate lyase [Pseudomonadota bacterium]|jgi:4-amino-4-deoxychorismate lyase|nr:MAG: aminodeoxychorismate lyase [Pseudomonadota bacterium]
MNALPAAAMPLEVLVDGAACREAWPLDRGLLYGDGLFETMRVMHGRIRFEELHAARLADGCRRLGIGIDLDHTWAAVRVAAQRHGEATLRLTVTRGTALARGYTPTGREQARTVLAVYPPPGAGEIPQRVRVVTLRATLGENPLLAGMKHLNRLEQVLARRELAARGGGAFEGLVSSSSGALVSGTMSNVFLDLDGELVTPSLETCGVAGVMRAAVLREATRAGCAVREARIPLSALARCRAMALTNARMGLVTVHELDGRALEGSEVLRELAVQVAEA